MTPDHIYDTYIPEPQRQFVICQDKSKFLRIIQKLFNILVWYSLGTAYIFTGTVQNFLDESNIMSWTDEATLTRSTVTTLHYQHEWALENHHAA